MKSIKTVLLTSLLTLTLLQGCGFHLRGAVLLPEEMAATWVVGDSVSNELLQGAQDAIRNTNGDLAGSESVATAVLVLSNETFSRRVATVGSDGKVSEYLLNYQVAWKLRSRTGATLREGVLKQRENYAYDSSQVLGKTEEERYLRQVMVEAAVRDLLRALRKR